VADGGTTASLQPLVVCCLQMWDRKWLLQERATIVGYCRESFNGSRATGAG